VIIVLVITQVMIAAKMASGTIGFDHPGTSGLDFGEAIELGIIYTIAFFIGSVSALVVRAWKTAGLQMAIIVILGALLSIR